MTISSWSFLSGSLGTGANTLFDFATLKGMVFMTDYANSRPLAWEGISTSAMAQGYRLSWGYTATGTTLNFTVDPIDNATLTMAASQPASGLYRGKLLYIEGGATAHSEIVGVDSFTTTGTPGDSNYYVTEIVLGSKVKPDRVTASFNGATVASTSTGGSIATTGLLTCFKVMGITQLKSGGYRASEEMSIDVKNGSTGQIQISDLLMNLSYNGAYFGFDIPSNATTWFMTQAFNPQLAPSETGSGSSQVYYQIPANFMSSTNPTSNSDTAFDISTMVAGTEHTTTTEYNLEQSYFTLQVDAPKVKYMRVYQNFMLEAGDPCHTSRLWISELLSPHIWSEFGGTQGSYLDINPDDGDVITGIKVWTTYVFIFKNHSVFRVNFTGEDATPFTVEKLSGSIGALSHFAIQETDRGVVFLSEKGPAIIKGFFVTYTAFGGPQDSIGELSGVDPLFDQNYTGHLNFAALAFSTSANDTQHKRLWFGVTTGTDSTYRDKALVYDYSHDAWWLNDSVANYYAPIQDDNGFITVWSGNYLAEVFQQEVGYTDSPGNSISFTYTMPPIYSAEMFSWMNLRHLYIAGIPSDATLGASTLTVTATLMPGGATQVLTADMTSAALPSGLYIPLAGDCRSVQLKFDHDDDVPLQITGVRLDYEPQGERV